MTHSDPPAVPDPTEADLAAVLALQRSGVFDGIWFLARNPDLVRPGVNPIGHFHRWGWREGRWPNAYFDTGWYLATNPDVAAAGIDPLLHYVTCGEAEGRAPIGWFEPGWYRTHYAVPDGMLALAHFLAHRHAGRVSPIAAFDAAWYLVRHPDVAAAGMDPFEHYRVSGAAEGRAAAPGFDAEAYRRVAMADDPGGNPLLHCRRREQDGPGGIAAEIRRATQPGPLFEPIAPLPAGARLRAMLLAFYLPQFHATPENDAWWGTGFTEWTSLARGVPRFAGHYQPRVPRDLGHYTLAGGEVLRRQAAMARGAGLHGFVFYHYQFGPRRLLEAPMEALLADPTIDLPFCLMWANETWTRRWDGAEGEVLVEQTYHPADDPALIDDLVRHFADPRYIRLEGRPVLMLYRAADVPTGAVAQWRALFAACGETPLLVMAQSFGDRDPRLHGMDAAVEFPPHKHTAGLAPITAGLRMLDAQATLRVFAYDDVAAATDLDAPPYPLIRTAVPGWDNDPRRQGAGMALHGATPAAYQAWLDRLVVAAQAQKVGGAAIVCVNAWNEWGEGAYLEPDVHFGAAFLNATARAMHDAPASRRRLLLVGHDAFPAGAQLLLLHLGRHLAEVRGIGVSFLLQEGGALLPDYAAVGPTVLAAQTDVAALARGHAAALVNSAASAALVPGLVAANLPCVLLVHELPGVLRQRGLVDTARAAVAVARHVVFGAPHVRDRFSELVPLDPSRSTVATQGLYRPPLLTQGARAERRAQLRVPEAALLAVGLGHGDLRKGIDLFLQVWRTVRRHEPSAHFLWVGDIDPLVAAHLGPEIAAATATGHFHHRPFHRDGADWLAAADVHVLTAREDPMPSAVLEAMAAGVPSVAFEDTGGAPDLLRERGAGVAVPLGDVAAMARRLRGAARLPALARARMAAGARRDFAFPAYAARLLALACPNLVEVSVVVPAWNSAAFLEARLGSVFGQTYPVREVVVLDDASDDASAAVAQAVAAAAGREIAWHGAARNSGSVFGQWRRAAELATGEWIWIAEADDVADPAFLAGLCGRLEGVGDAVMAFCDSRAIGVDAEELWPDHQAHYAGAGAGLLAQDGVLTAAEMLLHGLGARNLVLNVSAVLFRRSALLAALDRCGAELEGFRIAGDWRVYAELLSMGGRVVYAAAPLNQHRRHAGSVSGRAAAGVHLAEFTRMQRHMRGVLGRKVAGAQRAALAEVRRVLGVS